MPLSFFFGSVAELCWMRSMRSRVPIQSAGALSAVRNYVSRSYFTAHVDYRNATWTAWQNASAATNF